MTKQENVSWSACFDVETISAPELEPAIVYSAQNSTGRGKRIAIKTLRPFADKRYNLMTPFQRHRCLVEGIQWNRKFTYHGDYIGLGRIASEEEGKRICFDQLIRRPKSIEELDKDAEYAILMNWLPHKYRLDNVLQKANGKSLTRHLTKLAHYIVDLHQNTAKPCSPEWGSIAKLQEKLEHNIELFDDVQRVDSALHFHFSGLKKSIYTIFDSCQAYFKERVTWIRRCHGDLKCSNIWMMRCIHILDAVDFNPLYSNIDIISDFAMLVVDVQAHMLPLTTTPMSNIDEHLHRCTMVTNILTEKYLELIDQDNETSRSVLEFYLLEKAIVRAAISIAYGKYPELGLSYFRIAEMHLQNIRQHASLI